MLATNYQQRLKLHAVASTYDGYDNFRKGFNNVDVASLLKSYMSNNNAHLKLLYAKSATAKYMKVVAVFQLQCRDANSKFPVKTPRTTA